MLGGEKAVQVGRFGGVVVVCCLVLAAVAGRCCCSFTQVQTRIGLNEQGKGASKKMKSFYNIRSFVFQKTLPKIKNASNKKRKRFQNRRKRF